MKKKIGLNLLISLLVFVLFLLGLEVFLRTTHAFGARLSWSQPDALLGWRFIPNGTFQYLEENPQSITWQTNSYGWKDREWSVEKNAGTTRIAVLGDSYVEALQVSPKKNFLALAETNLNKKGAKTEWMNFGRSGFGPSEEWLVLQNEVFRFHPDRVILFFYPVNDLDDVSLQTAADPIRPFYHQSPSGELQLDTTFNQRFAFQLKSFTGLLKKHSALVSLLAQRTSLLRQTWRQKKIRKERKQERALQGYLSLATSSPDPVYLKNYALSKQIIQKMAEFTKIHGADFLLVSIDIPAYIPEVEAVYKKRDPSFDAQFFEKSLAALAEKLAISYLGLQTPFREIYLKKEKVLHWPYWTYEGRPEYWEYGAHTGHWNEEGHALVAELLNAKIDA